MKQTLRRRKVCFACGALDATGQQKGLIVQLTAEGAGGLENPGRNLRKRISWGGCDEAVEALDAELLLLFVGDLENAVGCDDEEVAGRGFKREAVELRDGEKADWKLWFLTL